MSVGVNPPKTPVHKGSTGIAAATIPNICKMPGPPAPFVPAPLPNIAKSGDSPKKYTKKVKIEDNTVAIKGASFKSIGDVASKGTGGGLISANTHGPAKFIGPGSMDVKFEGKNVQLLSDPMTNNGGGSGNPPNAATMMGVVQLTAAERKEIRDAMKSDDNVCPDGNPQHPEHEWEEEPDLPKGSTRESIDILKESKDTSEEFEGYAAEQNVEDGDLVIEKRDRKSKVSRDPTEEEMKAGAGGDDHKVFRSCKREGCGNRSEIDHVVDDTGQAEAKNVDRFDSFDQMKRNQTIQEQTGAAIIYKINGEKENADKVKATIEYAAKVSGLRTTVKEIFMTAMKAAGL